MKSIKNDRFWYSSSPTPKLLVYAYESVSKLIPKSMLQNLANSVSFGTALVLFITMTTEQKKRPLKAKIVVAPQDELGQVPKQDEIEQVFTLTRVMYKALLGLHFQRKERKKKSGQLTIF